MLMSTDVASLMLPVSRGIMERDRDIDTAAGAPAAVRGMKRGDPEPDAQTAAALTDLTGAECKRARIDPGTGTVVGDIGQVRADRQLYYCSVMLLQSAICYLSLSFVHLSVDL